MECLPSMGEALVSMPSTSKETDKSKSFWKEGPVTAIFHSHPHVPLVTTPRDPGSLPRPSYGRHGSLPLQTGRAAFSDP